MQNISYCLRFLICFSLLETHSLICSVNASNSGDLFTEERKKYPVSLDLRNEDLSWKDLSHKDYTNADLRGVNFSHAILHKTKFLNAKLTKANFQYSDLTEADFTNACLNGARFKGAKFFKTIFDETPNAKGTLIADKRNFENILKEEQKTTKIIQELKDSKRIFILRNSSSLTTIQKTLYQGLRQAQQQKKNCSVVSFQEIKSKDRIQDCYNFLLSPFFKDLVSDVKLLSHQKIFFIHVKDQNAVDNPRIFSKMSRHSPKAPKLDLHGKIPLDIKRQQIDQFVLTAHTRRIPSVEIITGRGLHNPQGEMGVLWGNCQKYLLSKRLRPYVQDIVTISLNGGWRVMLKNSAFIKKKEDRKKRNLIQN